MTSLAHARITAASSKPFRSSSRTGPANSIMAELCYEAPFFAAMIAACFTGAARFIQIGFTPACVVLGVYLLRKSSSQYISFVLWLWFLSPFIRRLADYHAGWRDPSQILLAPIAVSLLCALPILRSFSHLFRRESLCFSLAALGVLYGFVLGALRFPLQSVVVDLLRWSTPLIFAFYCFALCSRDEVSAVLKRTVLYAMPLLGAYGIWQYFNPPSWDLYWLSNVDAPSFGSASFDAVRVFGTMNSPGPFATTLAACILLLFGAKSRMAAVSQAVGLIALILTEVRSAWIGLVAGLLWLLFRSTNATRRRMLVFAVLACTTIGLAAILQQSVADNIAKRFSTFSDMRQDESYQERVAGSKRALAHALHNFYGEGMGFLDSAFFNSTDGGGTDLGKHDDGIYEFLVTLGYSGTLLYGLGLMGILSRGISHRAPGDGWHVPLFAVCLSIVVQVPSGNSLQGVDGFVFWLAAALILKHSSALPASGTGDAKTMAMRESSLAAAS